MRRTQHRIYFNMHVKECIHSDLEAKSELKLTKKTPATCEVTVNTQPAFTCSKSTIEAPNNV